MKIKNISNDVIKIKLGTGKIYEFPPGKVRSIKKDLAESIVKKDPKDFEIEDNKKSKVFNKKKTKGGK